MDMNLEELKKALDKSSHSIQSSKKLIEQREELHKLILNLKEDIESDLLKMHTQKEKGAQNLQRWQEDIQVKSENLESLKQKIKEVDKLLDELGEEQEESLERIKKQIIDLIKKKYPEAASEYELLEKKLNEFRTKTEKLSADRAALAPFYGALVEGSAAGEKRSFWSFLFGRHPKVVLSSAIRKAELEAENIRKIATDPRIVSYLDSFIEEVKKSWNHSLYNGKFEEYFMRFKQIMEDLDQEILYSNQEIIKLETQLDKLIEKYCC